MKIVFTDSILDTIAKRLYEGRAANKKAEYILISDAEYAELRNDRRFFQHCDNGMNSYCSPNDLGAMRETAFKTIRLDEPNPRGARSPCVTFAPSLKFQDVDVYVVPARFL